MKGHPFIYLLALALAVFTTTARAAAPACVLSAPEISKEIQQKGVDELMHRLSQGHDGKIYDYTGFNQLVSCIWTGKKAWLDIAVPVIAETHPDSEDDLADAVQNALAINPETVLSEPWPDSFNLHDYVCWVAVDDYTDPHISDSTNYRNATAELNRRVALVKKIKRPDLQEQVKACLSGFEESRKALSNTFLTPQKSSDSTVPPAPDPGTAPPPPFIGKG